MSNISEVISSRNLYIDTQSPRSSDSQGTDTSNIAVVNAALANRINVSSDTKATDWASNIAAIRAVMAERERLKNS